MRPLDRISSIKMKLSVVIVAAVAITALISTIGLRTGIPVWIRPIISAGIALLLVYPFSRGITSPLREMVAASRAMAAGDPSPPISDTSRDEVGELARAFVAMRAQLAELDRQRSDLIANVSHELRTPLAGLRARLENIADGVEPADADSVAASLAEVERLTVLVDQLLDLSRLESGTAPLHVEPFPVAMALDPVVDGLGRTHPDVLVDLDVADDLTFTGDRSRLTQLAINLGHNAARHSPPGGTVRIEAVDRGGGIALVVRDQGPGIAPEERARVFERFYRSDHARSADAGGSGLGLAIVRSIVDLHGGAITIDDDEPTGCVVTLELPDQEVPS